MQLVLLQALPLAGRMWDAVRSTFSDAFPPTLYELGGSVQEWADAIVEECRDEELLVVGNSVGGSCALEIARAAPDRVCRVVLVGAKVDVRRDGRLRDEAVGVLRRDGIATAWDLYWKPGFGSNASAEVVAKARQLALEQDVGDARTVNFAGAAGDTFAEVHTPRRHRSPWTTTCPKILIPNCNRRPEPSP